MEGDRLALSSLSSSHNVTEHILKMPDEKIRLIVGLLWSWWNARNKSNAGEGLRSTDEVIFKARSLTQHVQQDEAGRSAMVVRANDQRWVPPLPDVWKINVDAAFWEKEALGTLGFVVRDDQCAAVMAGAGKLAVVTDALCAEAHACVAALQAAAAQGMQKIVLESDSQTLIKALQTTEHDLAPGGVLFREAKFMLATMFSSTSIVHAYRSCNSVAHALARFGRKRDPDHPIIWMHPLPSIVNNLLVCDSTTG